MRSRNTNVTVDRLASIFLKKTLYILVPSEQFQSAWSGSHMHVNPTPTELLHVCETCVKQLHGCATAMQIIVGAPSPRMRQYQGGHERYWKYFIQQYTAMVVNKDATRSSGENRWHWEVLVGLWVAHIQYVQGAGMQVELWTSLCLVKSVWTTAKLPNAMQTMEIA